MKVLGWLVAGGMLFGLISAQRVEAQNFDHLRCFEIEKADQRVRALADVIPQQEGFGGRDCRVRGPVSFCVPVQKTNVEPAPPGGVPGPEETDHLCYRLRCPEDEDDDDDDGNNDDGDDDDDGNNNNRLRVTDQFGTFRLKLDDNDDLLCTPAVKEGAATTTTQPGTTSTTVAGTTSTTVAGTTSTVPGTTSTTQPATTTSTISTTTTTAPGSPSGAFVW